MSEKTNYFTWENEFGDTIELLGVLELTGEVFEKASEAANPHKMNFILMKAASKAEKDYASILKMKQKDIQLLIQAWNLFETE